MPGSACMAGDWHPARSVKLSQETETGPGDPGGRRELLASTLISLCPTAQLQLIKTSWVRVCVIHSFLPASLD